LFCEERIYFGGENNKISVSLYYDYITSLKKIQDDFIEKHNKTLTTDEWVVSIRDLV